jgi:HAMP domain-containing protein
VDAKEIQAGLAVIGLTLVAFNLVLLLMLRSDVERINRRIDSLKKSVDRTNDWLSDKTRIYR